MAESFIERQRYRALERINTDMPIFPPLRGEVGQQLDPKRWKRKQLADNLMYATWMLRRKPLSIKYIEDFGTWKQDLQKVWSMMFLSGKKYWATENCIIAMRLDQDLHASCQPIPQGQGRICSIGSGDITPADRRKIDDHRPDQTEEVEVRIR